MSKVAPWTNNMKVEFLRKKYPRFIYRKYSYKINKGSLKISFLFEVPPDIQFRPQLTIKNVTRKDFVTLNNLVFHLGLIGNSQLLEGNLFARN